MIRSNYSLTMSLISRHLNMIYPNREWSRGQRYRYRYEFNEYEESGVTVVFEGSVLQLVIKPIDSHCAVLHAAYVPTMMTGRRIQTGYRLLIKVTQAGASEMCFITVSPHPETAEGSLQNDTGYLLTNLRVGTRISLTVFL